MPEQTNPTGVSQEAPGTFEHAVELLSQSEDHEGEPAQPEVPEQSQEQEQPEGQAQTDELSPDDIPDEKPVEQPAVDAFELVHNGQQVKLSREETIKYAMQGYDYTQKTQALAKDRQLVDHHLQRLAQIEQVTPQLQGQLAQVKALEAQLAPYQQVNWVQEAATDASRYAQLRAQYDVLRDTYAQAVNQYRQMDGAVKQQLQGVMSQRLQAEAQMLPQLIPEWKDEAKLEGAKADISKHFAANYGIDPAALNAEANTALKVAVLYKAMKYDQLVKSKADKSKTLRNTPPVTVPGASNPQLAKADKQKELQSKLRKSGSMDDAVAILLNR